MDMRLSRCMIMVVVVMVLLNFYLQTSNALRFVLDREECFSHKAEYEGDMLHVSFVVVDNDSSWNFVEKDGVDLVINGPEREQIHDSRDKASDKFEFVIQKKGVYRLCFTNKSPYHETVDFDVRTSHVLLHHEHAKDEHLKPLEEHLAKLEDALFQIEFEQHWIEAQTYKQEIINEKMSRRAIHKALLESASLVGAAFLQVYLLKRLFERKLGSSKV